MPIKQIQLRGISRNPSDKTTEDGGVAESLNAIIDGQETAPVLNPTNVAARALLPGTDWWPVNYKAVMIHKVNGERFFIYIARNENDEMREALVAFKDQTGHPGSSVPDRNVIWIYPTIKNTYLDEGEKFREDSIKAVGNALVFSTDKQNGYMIFRNGKYEYKGSSLPHLDIVSKPVFYYKAPLSPDDQYNALFNTGIVLASTVNKDIQNTFLNLSTLESKWGSIKNGDGSYLSDPDYMEMKKLFWQGVEEGGLLNGTYFRFPVYVRFALRLVDGTFARHTVPILVGGHMADTFSYIFSAETHTVGSMQYRTATVSMRQNLPAYRIFTELLNAEELKQWKDVIQSVDMFISRPLVYPELNSDIVGAESMAPIPNPSGDTSYSNKRYSFTVQNLAGSRDEKESLQTIIEESARIFYLVKSYPLDNLSDLIDGYELRNDKEYTHGDLLYVKEELKDDFRSNHDYMAARNYSINGRLISTGVSEVFGPGQVSPYSLIPLSGTAQRSYRFVYRIQDNDGAVRYVNSGRDFVLPSIEMNNTGSSGTNTTTVASDMRQLLFYPDTRCDLVYVIDNATGKVAELPMKVHPTLNQAWYHGDIDKGLSELTFEEKSIPAEDKVGYSYRDRYIFQSPVYNPFIYPVEGRYRISANVIAVASITTALSQGQFGQFTLYAFTDEGIWAMRPGEDGKYVSVDPNPVSRDVVLSATTVASIDQAIVFITARGVMLLNGSEVSCLSASMTGRNYIIEDAAMEVLGKYKKGADYSFALQESVPFMGFMTRDVQIAYDYSGERLIFFSPDKSYQYIYKIRSGTWHRYIMPRLAGGKEFREIKVMNSFPDCYVFMKRLEGETWQNDMHDFSTVLDSSVYDEPLSDQENSARSMLIDDMNGYVGIVATRPFDLGEPDTLKTVRDVRIRGLYGRYLDATGKKRSRVQYILLGSQNGIDFYRLKSLRGKGWKMFRLVIIFNLRATERISWVDIEYETRHTNKLR